MDIWIYLNGIRYAPGKLSGWPVEFTHLTHYTTHARAYPAEHHFFFIRNYKRLKEISQRLADLIVQYRARGYRVHFCTHSNGAVVACRTLDKLPTGQAVATFHAIAPAAWSSLERNGLNTALKSGQLQHFFFYGSTADKVVRLGRWTGKLLRPLGLGYGGMSYDGPRDVDPSIQSRVHTYWASQPNAAWLQDWRGTHESSPSLSFAHSDWFTPARYRQTFARVQQNTAKEIPSYAAHLQQVCQHSAASLPSLSSYAK